MLQRFDFMTIIGFSAAVVVVVSAVLLGSRLDLYWNIPAVMITVLGSFFTVIMQHDYRQVKDVFKVAKKAFSTETAEPQDLIPVFVSLARKARQEGLLALEEDVDLFPDPFFAKGLRLVVDGIDPDSIREILEAEIESMEERHEEGQSIFRCWASMAPSFGMIGTLVGLIQMLSKIDDPSALGPGLSVALLTTLYGVLLANLVFTPIAGKLELRSSQEVRLKTVILEGIISLQSGVNPRILEEKLKALIPPSYRYDSGPEVSASEPS